MVDGRADPPAPDPSATRDDLPWLALARALAADLPGLVTDRVRLLSLELQRATGTLGRLLALALVATMVLGTAWLALWAGLAVGMRAGGVPWPWVVGVVVVANLALGAWVVQRARALMPLLGLPATVRSMTEFPRPEHPDDEPSPRA